MLTNAYHLDRVYFSSPKRFGDVELLQIGRMFCDSTSIVDTHIHGNLYELTIITDGKGVIYTNTIPTPVKKGDIYLSFPADVHKIESDKIMPLKYDFFAFRIADSKLSKDFSLMNEDYSSPETRLFSDDRIRHLVGNAIAEIDGNDNYHEEILSAILNQILVYVVRGFQKIKPSPEPSITGINVLCYKMMNYIDTHIYSMKSLNELCKYTDYSYGYLSALFKKTTGGSLSNYYRLRRLETSRLLIVEGKLSISQISEQLGYSSLYAFSKAFKEYFGISPKKYKNQNN